MAGKRKRHPPAGQREDMSKPIAWRRRHRILLRIVISAFVCHEMVAKFGGRKRQVLTGIWGA